MPRYALQIAYVGTDFCGWQAQRGVGKHANPKPSIEETVAQAIEKQSGAADLNLVSSGRTDAGVHASGHVAHFDLENAPVPIENFHRGINRHLPKSIRIQKLVIAPDSFRAQKATRKQYSYYFQQGPTNLPHLRPVTMWNRYPLNCGKMDAAILHLLGTHDFAAFGSSGAKLASTTRTLFEAEVTREPIPLPGSIAEGDAHLLRLRIVGSGFLKQMMRSIAGTLKQIGEGRREPEEMREILASKDRQLVGPTAPASGLWLDRVWYEEEVFE